MGFLNWFSGNSETTNRIVDTVASAGDMMFFTDEEKSIVNEKKRDLWFKFMELSRDESSIKSMTRRVLAFLIIGHWFLFLDLGVIARLMGHTENAVFFFGVAESMMWVVGPVATFYFGLPFLNRKKG